MKIINLADDIKAENDLLSQHGLSFYIEVDSKKYLFDIGASEVFIRNANRLGVSIRDVDALFISHNHYDHIGGLLYFMEVNKKAKIYIKEDALYRTFYMRDYLQCPLGNFYEQLSHWDRVIFVKDSIKIDNFYLVSDTNGNTDYFCQGTKFFMDKDGKTMPDDFSHEMFLVYIKDNKSNILSACSHRGIINIIETTKSKFSLPIHNVIAGLHLSADSGKTINCTPEYYHSLLDYFEAADITKIYTCHCTGIFAYKLLKKELKNRIDYFYAGDEIRI